MKNITHRIIRKIQKKAQPEERIEHILLASELFKARNLKGYTPDIQEEGTAEITDEDLDEIETALEKLLDEGDELTAEIIYALGNTYKKSRKKLYASLLERHMERLLRHSNIINQITIALDNIDEPIIEVQENGAKHQSIIDIEKNMRQAQKYLREI
ncbi:MAG: hypothetical protein ACLFR1_12835 [Spirochaetia bacterium]